MKHFWFYLSQPFILLTIIVLILLVMGGYNYPKVIVWLNQTPTPTSTATPTISPTVTFTPSATSSPTNTPDFNATQTTIAKNSFATQTAEAKKWTPTPTDTPTTTPSATPDLKATQTAIAKNRFATQTAEAKKWTPTPTDTPTTTPSATPDLKATQTAIAKNRFATQTAEAAEWTPTPTNTPTPTITPQTVSPQGRIFFRSRGIGLANISDNSQVQILETSNALVGCPLASLDKDLIAISIIHSPPQPESGIYVNNGGTNLKQIVSSDGRALYLQSWTDNDNLLYFSLPYPPDWLTERQYHNVSISNGVSVEVPNPVFFVADRLGHLVFDIVESGKRDSRSLSPNGEKAVVSANIDGAFNLWVMSPDGTNRSKITTIGNTSSPEWSPDGNKIAFESNADGSFKIYTVNADGSQLTMVAEGKTPTWSPDGEWLAFSAGGRIFISKNSGTNNQKIAEMGDCPQWIK